MGRGRATFHAPLLLHCVRMRSGNGVKGAYLPVEIFAPKGRKYNRLPLDGVTRITLFRKEKELLHLFPPPGKGGFGQSPEYR